MTDLCIGSSAHFGLGFVGAIGRFTHTLGQEMSKKMGYFPHKFNKFIEICYIIRIAYFLRQVDYICLKSA